MGGSRGDGSILHSTVSVSTPWEGYIVLSFCQDATIGGKGSIGSLCIISYNYMPICNCLKMNSLTNEWPACKDQEDRL